jgi:hypothetical protein
VATSLRTLRTWTLLVLQLLGAWHLTLAGTGWRELLAYAAVSVVIDFAWIGGKGWASLAKVLEILAGKWRGGGA